MHWVSDHKLIHSLTAQVEEYLKEVNKGNDDGAILLDDADISLGDFTFAPDNISQDANTSSSASDPTMSFDIPNFTSQDGSAFNMNNQLMGLGMSEALPPFEMIEELYDRPHCFVLVSSKERILTVTGTTSTSPPIITFSPSFILAATTRLFTDHQPGNRQCVCSMEFGRYLRVDTLNMTTMPKLSTKEHGNTWKQMR